MVPLRGTSEDKLLGPVLLSATQKALASTEVACGPKGSQFKVDTGDRRRSVHSKRVAPRSAHALVSSSSGCGICVPGQFLSRWPRDHRSHEDVWHRILAACCLRHSLLMGVLLDRSGDAQNHAACSAKSYTPSAAPVRMGNSIRKWLLLYMGFFPALSQVGEASGIPHHGKC